MKKILCLDFDGIICDSQKECLIVSYNAYNSFHLISKEPIYDLKEIPDEIRNKFYEYRYLVRPAKEYWLLIDLILSNKYIPDQEMFDDLVIIKSRTLEQFELYFFHERKYLMKKKPDLWFSLHALYKEFSDYWNAVKEKFEVYVITNKNHDSVVALLNCFKINIPVDHIWSMEKKIKKFDAIKKIVREKRVPKEDVYFVDDHPEYVESMGNMGIKSYLAGWGYNKKNVTYKHLITDLSFFLKHN